ncbi:hypothetical protein QQX98_013300 [Neonectria punicea]|uniref:MARVEL domain-containing protein n=1 Tax=Neonectria punicea TaxID=979145 RepID=A0ABR1GGA3_9HYPO
MEQQTQPPPHHQEKPAGDHVLQTPVWVMVIRGFQILISIIILGLCASLMHDAYIAEEGFSLAIALFTWVGVGYIIATEKVPSFRGAYHIVAVLVIDGLLIVLWLAAFASMAALRARYVVDVTVGDCVDDGSLLDSKTCSVARSLEKRNNVILFKSGLAMTAAIAGLGALMWLLFIAAFVWTLLTFLRGRKEGRFALNTAAPASPSNNYQMENKVAESTPMSPQTYPSQTQPQPPPVAFQENQYQQQQQQGYAPQGQPYQQPQSPYQQQQGYPPPQEQQNFGQYPPQQQQQQPYQQPIQSQMTGQSQPVSTAYGSELDGQNSYQGHPPVSPPPQQYQQPYHPQN